MSQNFLSICVFKEAEEAKIWNLTRGLTFPRAFCPSNFHLFTTEHQLVTFALLARLLIINNIYTHAAAKCQPFLQHFFFHKFFKQKIKPPFLFSQALNRNKTVLFLLSQGDVMERARIWIHK